MSQSPNGPRTKIPDYRAVVNVRYDGISTIVKNPVDAANHENRQTRRRTPLIYLEHFCQTTCGTNKLQETRAATFKNDPISRRGTVDGELSLCARFSKRAEVDAPPCVCVYVSVGRPRKVPRNVFQLYTTAAGRDRRAVHVFSIASFPSSSGRQTGLRQFVKRPVTSGCRGRPSSSVAAPRKCQSDGWPQVTKALKPGHGRQHPAGNVGCRTASTRLSAGNL